MARRGFGYWARQVFMALACVVFTVFGLVFLIVGEGEDRLVGLMSVLLFGVLGAMYFLLPRFTRGGKDGMRPGIVEHRGERRPALVFPLSRAKLRLAVIGCAAFVAIGVLLLMIGAFWIGIVAVLVFGGVALAGVRKAFSRHAYVALLADGILSRAATSYFVPWEAIDGVSILEIHGSRMVSLSADPASVETATSGQLAVLLSRGAGFPELSFSGLVASEDELHRTIDHYLRHPGERERIGTAATLDPAVPR